MAAGLRRLAFLGLGATLAVSGATAAEPAGEAPPIITLPDAPRERVSEPCRPISGFGPFAIDGQSPFVAMRLGLTPRSASVLPAGRSRLASGMSWMNIWSVDKPEDLPDSFGEYNLDFETLHGWLDWRHGMGEGSEWHVRLGNRNRFGGELDALVDAFHNNTGLPDGGRSEAPRDQFVFELRPENGDPISVEGVGNFRRELTLGHTRVLSCDRGAWPQTAVGGEIRYRADDGGDLSGGDVDAGLFMALARQWGDWIGYFNLALIHSGANRFRGLALARTMAGTLVGVEWRYWRNHSILFQWQAHTGATARFGPYADTAHELNFGWRGQVRPGLVIGFAGFENFVNLDNSPDIGGTLTLEWGW